jgi:hypothetical protein
MKNYLKILQRKMSDLCGDQKFAQRPQYTANYMAYRHHTKYILASGENLLAWESGMVKP